MGSFPPFAIGRFHWDNFMTRMAIEHGFAVDATPMISAVHLNHDYSHSGGKTRALRGQLANANRLLIMTHYKWSGLIKSPNASQQDLERVYGPNGYPGGHDVNHLVWTACPECKDHRRAGHAFLHSKKRGWFPWGRVANLTMGDSWGSRCRYASAFSCPARTPTLS